MFGRNTTTLSKLLIRLLNTANDESACLSPSFPSDRAFASFFKVALTFGKEEEASLVETKGKNMAETHEYDRKSAL